MLKQRRVREKGKLRLSEYFKELKEGDKVSIIKDLAKASNFPIRMHGKTGTVKRKQGNFFVVELNDGNKTKKLIVEATHLKKLKTS